MSNYWNLHCATCDTPGPFHWNHGEDHLVIIRRHLPAIAALYELYCEPLYGIDFRFSGPETQSDVIGFAFAHHTHDVRVRSEYGYDHDQCTEFVSCKCCSTQFNCVHKAGHEGPCEPDYKGRRR